ncbi:hypothetical protein HDU96_007263 [Phlyctochytrium bullatum]|nr:hypothetical protein HDU96_007263 [Phlyctochytrium bullatum]
MLVEPAFFFEENGVPVFKPTYEQFKDFAAFMNSVEPYGRVAGLIKVIPPKEWRQKLPDVTQALRKVQIKNAITQEIKGGGLPPGIYRQVNVEKRRVYSVQQWFDLAESAVHRSPTFDTEGRVNHTADNAPVKRKRNRTTPSKPAALGIPEHPTPTSPTPASSVDLPMADAKNEEEHGIFVEPEFDGHSASDDASEATKSASLGAKMDGDDRNVTGTSEDKAAASSIEKMEQDTTTHETAEDANDERDEIYEEGAEGEGNGESTVKIPRKRKRYNPDGEDIYFDVRKVSCGYSLDYCKDLERFYWKNITYVAPMYGADLLGSLWGNEFNDSWNLNKLDNILQRLDMNLPGTLFIFRYVEGNFCLACGRYGPVFNKVSNWRQSNAIFAEEKCPEFLRHKTCVMSPASLANRSIPVNRLIQYAGEFVITFPFGYHSGFNLGFNCAESVNFALESWIEVGRNAQYCRCVKDSVKLDVAALFDARPMTPPPEKKKKPPQKLRRVETYIINTTEDEDSETIAGVDTIPRDRWSLGKCVRAYHVTCANDNGIMLTEDFQCFCPQHDGRPKVAKRVDVPKKVDTPDTPAMSEREVAKPFSDDYVYY